MKIFAFLVLSILLSSCNESPILNHKRGQNNTILSPVKEWAKVDWIHAPVVNENSAFELQLNEELLPNEILEIELFMPSMGHGSSPVVIEKVNALNYFVDEVYFIMPGDWEVRIYKKLNGKVKDDFIIRLNL